MNGAVTTTRCHVGLACFTLLFAALGGRAASLAVRTGDILAVNHGDNSVYRIDSVTGDQRRLGIFQVPTDLALSPDGFLYVSEYRGTIQRLNLTNGTISAVNPATSLWNVNGLVLGPSGDLYVTCAASNSVIRVNPITGSETVITAGNLLSVPVGIDFLDSGHLVVSSYLGNNLVNVALAEGSQSVIAKAVNGIDRPWGVAMAGTNIYVAARDSKILQRVWGSNVVAVLSMPSPIFGLGLERDGNILVGGVSDIARVSPGGGLTRSFPGGFSELTGLEVSRIAVETLGVTNTPPNLAPLPDRTVNEGTPLTFAASAVDTNWPPQVWNFSLAGSVPLGAGITTNGVFTWTPSESHGPGIYPITVVVTDDGVPPQSASATFTVTVNEVNAAPTLSTLSNWTVVAGTSLLLTVNGADPDLPPQSLTYAMLPGAPAGANLSAAGEFFWTPRVDQAPSTNLIQLTVTDNGVPALTATNSFTVTVNQVNVAPTLESITNQVVNEGDLLSFVITAFDSNRPPQQLTYSLRSAAPAGVTLAPTGQFSWTPSESQGPGTYLVEVQVSDNGSPPLSSTTLFTVSVNEVNQRPAIDPIADALVPSGTTVIRSCTATDADLPVQALSFSLAAGVPPGATISPGGLFTWTPSGGQNLGTNVVQVVVTDAGVPSLSATQSFSIVVRPNLSVETGDLLVADYGGNEVLKVNPRTGAAQSLGVFNAPTDVALAADGSLYVAEAAGTVQRLDLVTQQVTLVNTNTALSDLWGIQLAPSGDLVALNSADGTVVRLDPVSGVETVLTRSNLLSVPYGMDLLDDTHLLVSSFGNDRLVSVSLVDGSQTLVFESGGISFPWGVAASPTGIYVTSWDQQLVQKLSGGAISNLLWTDGTPQALALETNGSIVVGLNGLTSSLVRLHPDGTSSNLLTTGLVGPIAGLRVSKYGFGASSGSNTAPVMDAFPSLTVFEGSTLSFTAVAADADFPTQTLAFSLDAAAPPGAAISPAGVFTWTPSDAQGPGNYDIHVIVTDNGTPPLSSTNHLKVTVNELYLQSSGSVFGPYSDEPEALLDYAAHSARVDIPATPSRFYRLRCNLPVRITNLHLQGAQALLQYQFQ